MVLLMLLGGGVFIVALRFFLGYLPHPITTWLVLCSGFVFGGLVAKLIGLN